MNKIYFGDCRESLRAMAADGVKVQMCVTSPPYFGLRDYGHEGQIGLEETPEQFIAELVEVFRCVRDVLADDGTLWVNIGDSYSRNPSKGGSGPGGKNGAYSDTYTKAAKVRQGSNYLVDGRCRAETTTNNGIKHKDLIGIPWMLAFALRADGWYLRQDIIWHKPNPMPESVTDRCTKAHEYVFLLSKSAKYFYDHEAAKEPAVWAPSKQSKEVEREPGYYGGKGTDASRNDKNFKAIREMRNRRSVWTIATKPYAGAHFAVFPSALVEPCILAGTSDSGHCPLCGSRFKRVVEKTAMVINKTERNDERGTRTGTSGTMVSPASSITVGWASTCSCGVAAVADIVLDCFMGSGTTAAVAIEHGRQFIGCELNIDYKPLQDQRIAEARAAVEEIELERIRAAAQLDLFAEKAPEAA